MAVASVSSRGFGIHHPCSKWILPAFCCFCKHVMSATEIENQLPSSCSVEDIIAENECIVLMLECQQFSINLTTVSK